MSKSTMLVALCSTGARLIRAVPGKEDLVLRIASAYEAASKRRMPPPAFGALPIN
jgi:amidase